MRRAAIAARDPACADARAAARATGGGNAIAEDRANRRTFRRAHAWREAADIADDPGPIPLEFRHVWAIERKDCTADPALTRIAAAPGAVRFYEGRSVVAGADMSTTGLLTLDVEHVSEGQTINETHKLRLGADARTLTYERRGATFVYARCD